MDEKTFNKCLSKIKKQKFFNILYRYYFPKIVSHIYYKFNNDSLGEDVAQEFFTKLIRGQNKTYIEHPTAWVFVVCDNIAIDFLTNEKRYNLAYIMDESTSADGIFDSILYGDYVKKLDTLNEETKRIIKMHFYEGYNLREISELLGINYNTVRQKCSRGLKKLK